MKKLYKGMQDPSKTFLLIGSDEEVNSIKEELKGQGISPQVQSIMPNVLPDALQELEGVAAVCCVPGTLPKSDLLTLRQFCQDKSAALFFCMPGLAALQENMQVRNVGFMSFLSPVPEPLSHWWNRLIKRLFDLLVSGAFLFFLFPFIYIVAAVIIKRKSPGPVFSLTKERNMKGKTFSRLDFRTDALPETLFLQKSSVKKMPQLLNVFLGDMPVVPGLVKCQFCKDADVWYRQNWSLWLDIRILVKAMFNKNKIE